MNISTNPDGTVYVRWHDGGPYTVLDERGTVTRESGMGGITQWAEATHDGERERAVSTYRACREATSKAASKASITGEVAS